MAYLLLLSVVVLFPLAVQVGSPVWFSLELYLPIASLSIAVMRSSIFLSLLATLLAKHMGMFILDTC